MAQKDGWDKLGIIAQVCSSILIGILGLLITFKFNTLQDQHAADQLKLAAQQGRDQLEFAKKQLETSQQQGKNQQDLAISQMNQADRQSTAQLSLAKQQGINQTHLEREKMAGEYIEKIESTNDAEVRASLIRSLDVVTNPESAVRIAFPYAYPSRNGGDNSVAQAAIAVLRRNTQIGREGLIELLKQNNPRNIDEFTQAQMISALLSGRDTKMFIRIRDVDDFVEVRLNGRRIDHDKWNGGNDSGWIELTDVLNPGANGIEFLVKNSPYQGCGGHFQISVGTQQYDYAVGLSSCPPNQAAFRIGYAFDVVPSRDIVLHGSNVVLKPGVDWSKCVVGCLPKPEYYDTE